MRKTNAASLKDVAKSCGVSPMSVSNVINLHPHVSESLKRKVQAAIRELGYVPDSNARDLIRRKPRKGPMLLSGLRFAVVLRPEIKKFNESYFLGILRGIDDEIRERGHYLSFMETCEELERNPVRFNSLLSPENVDGTLTFAGPDHKEIFEHLERIGPLVHIDELDGYDCVAPDKAGATRQVVEHLLSLGHREIGFLGGRLASSLAGEPDKRFAAFKSELEARGLPFKDAWIKGCDYSFKGGYEAADALLKGKSHPTAVFCVSDLVAIGAMHRFLEAGVEIPERLSVVGFDDIPEAALFYPPLTSVNVPVEQIGRLAVRRVLEKLADPDDSEPRYIVVPAKLVERRTSAPPRRGGLLKS